MSNPLISAKKAELESRIVNIVTLNRANTLITGTVYCGRNSSRNSDCFNPLDLGLGNPYSHKNTNNCVWRVSSLEECLYCYKQWLWKLIQNENSQDNLMDWERMYLYKFLNLCRELDKVHTLVCFCINTYHNALNKDNIYCHTQILWNAAVWYNSQSFS